MTDRIEMSVDLAAPLDRVWHALTDAQAFGAWFGVALEAPFAVGEVARGRITHEGYRHVRWEATIVAIEPMRRFAFRWHPYAVDPNRDYSAEATTLVEFGLAPIQAGTHLTVSESGFDALPAERRDEAVRMNEGGWAAQIVNVAAYVGG